MDESCPSVAIQVSSDSTPAEVVIITLSERNGSFQISLGTGECKLFGFVFVCVSVCMCFVVVVVVVVEKN